MNWWIMASALWFLSWVLTVLALRQSLMLNERSRADHAKCIAHVASMSSNRVAAMALRHAAEKWDSVEEQSNLRQLAHERYSPGGPSMPVIWLEQQAELVETGR